MDTDLVLRSAGELQRPVDNMFSFAFFSTARQFIVSSPRLFSSSAALGYPKLKTHSGTKKRWRAIASGAFKRVSGVQFVLPAGY